MNTVLSAVSSFIRGLFNPANYTLHNVTVFVIVLMCIQYIPLETRAGVSPIKTVVMAVMPLVLLTHLRINKALIWGFLYVAWLFFTAGVLHPATFRASTILYTAMFMTTFIVVYTAVWDYHIFTVDSFIRFIRAFFFVLVGFLLAQQLCLIIGIKYFPLINLCQILNRGIGANSLTFEPSTLGRLLNVLYYVLLKCYEIRDGEKIKITEIFTGEFKWVTILFIWSVLTMGSGTAFVAVAITSLYFMRGWYFLLAIPIFACAFLLLSNMENNSFNRAQAVAMATMSGDANTIRETDMSASTRITPIINTFKLDFTKEESWIGHGCDWSISPEIRRSNYRVIGDVGDYGLIAYILSLLFVFSCCINFRSLATIMFFLGVGGGGGNIACGWGILMLFTCLKYLHTYQLEDYIYETSTEE